ncbi:MAG: cytochrome c oxidase subunit CcoP [Bacteroidetes bacterium]|nr:cytochrome c oxidase subunit CcoP [Bacteroidota bacterium]
MRFTQYTRSALLIMFSFLSLVSYAGETTPAIPAPSPASGDSMTYVLIAFAFMLLLAIVVLGQVLIRLTIHAYQNKNKIAKSLLLLLMMSVSGILFAQDGPSAPAAISSAAHNSSSSFSLNFIVAVCVILIEIFVIVIMLIRIWALINTLDPKPETKSNFHFEFPRWFDRFNESVAIEHEKDIMLDHDYDGIKELDNQLPPWWKYGFILTIFWAFGYMIYYHVMEAAPLSAGEYTNEMAQAKIAKDAYMLTAKNNVDENTIVYDKSYLADGQKIFTDNCVACHGAKGEGGVGPNLTDNNWLHGGKINDIFKTVKYGWPANGMKSWQADFSSMQIAQVVCYVKSMKGSNPLSPKAPQGDVYNDSDSSAAASVVVAKDSLNK